MKGQDGKHIFGLVKVGERGQIVIPKAARDIFDIHPGDSLLVLGDEVQGGIAIVKGEVLSQFAHDILSAPELDTAESGPDGADASPRVHRDK